MVGVKICAIWGISFRENARFICQKSSLYLLRQCLHQTGRRLSISDLSEVLSHPYMTGLVKEVVMAAAWHRPRIRKYVWWSSCVEEKESDEAFSCGGKRKRFLAITSKASISNHVDIYGAPSPSSSIEAAFWQDEVTQKR